MRPPAPIRHWHDGSGADPAVRPGDPVAARQWLSAAIGDDARLAELRRLATELSDGIDWSRADDHQLVEHMSTALVQGRLHTGALQPLELRRLVPPPAPPAPPPPPPAASSPRPSSPVAAPPPAETTFGSELDVAAMVAVLVQAAQDGVPFCEECARAAEAAA